MRRAVFSTLIPFILQKEQFIYSSIWKQIPSEGLFWTLQRAAGCEDQFGFSDLISGIRQNKNRVQHTKLSTRCQGKINSTDTSGNLRQAKEIGVCFRKATALVLTSLLLDFFLPWGGVIWARSAEAKLGREKIQHICRLADKVLCNSM